MVIGGVERHCRRKCIAELKIVLIRWRLAMMLHPFLRIWVSGCGSRSATKRKKKPEKKQNTTKNRKEQRKAEVHRLFSLFLGLSGLHERCCNVRIQNVRENAFHSMQLVTCTQTDAIAT